MVLHRLYSNLKSLSKKKENGYQVGRLRYKGKGWYKTFTYNQSGFTIIKTNTRLDILRLSTIGEIPVRMHRDIRGRVKQVIIKQYSRGKWYACVQTDNKGERQCGSGVIAVDVNTSNYLTDSDGRIIENPRFLKEKEERLKKEQRNLARKEEGSNNWNKQKRKLARVYAAMKNARMDFLHKITTAYVEHYDTIIVEDVQVSQMNAGFRYAKANYDAAWGLFKQLLLYKAESAGAEVVFVDPKGTTQTCANCGSHVPKEIWEREHVCPVCGFETTRDYNAARNILQRGLEKIGRERVESTPVETGGPTLTNVSASSVVEAGSSSLEIVAN
ncbi:MAG: IS200/IS605 family element transposase accessory protein TnpB [Candidatus Korarchaeota archaeon]|nr:IS200/IS605 family element transposase accessory protein TnpB [Candidatus Korarchaeota archaeon]NIU82945.1 IS200/IS605 family element transposase accessory protein TnpB [Candidatus Thorarchaeota archaeon]NIW13368.1 IS200/IS605 family element transposase accessory protein TnpB [Candidatus Thorarchaeota archaeon]NIW51468.1 IS200/IS605 family element transposase accessory protein TnpB [Candidatus Korarchaeota archaeon]